MTQGLRGFGKCVPLRHFLLYEKYALNGNNYLQSWRGLFLLCFVGFGGDLRGSGVDRF
jgi:hypothetical protein